MPYAPTIEFPEAFPYDAVEILTASLLGTEPRPDLHCTFAAAWHLQGYVMGQLVEHPAGRDALNEARAAKAAGTRSNLSGTPVPETDEGKAELLRQFRDQHAAAGEGTFAAIPWLMILDLVYEIVRSLIANKDA